MANKIIDKLGKTYGKLTVIGRSTDKNNGWICKCECGNTKIIQGKNLNTKNVNISCGCSSNWSNENKRIKLEGSRFDKLLVLEYDTAIKKYKCKCDCGNETFVCSKKLRKCHTTSCGCYRKQVCGNNSFRFTNDEFHEKLRNINFLSLDNYKGCNKLHEFQCNKNHTFNKTPEWLFRVHRCPVCHNESNPKKHNGYYTSKFFENNEQIANSIGYLYFIKCSNIDETFYKIGITRLSVEQRLMKIEQKYNVEKVKIVKGTMKYVYEMEKKFKKEYKKFSYKPLENFAGKNECFVF
jgi:hypothetical protein